MRAKQYIAVLHVFISAAVVLSLEADSEDSNCENLITVYRGTRYEASVGEELRIECPVVFCNNSPPTVSWDKLGDTTVPVITSSSSRIKTEWTTVNHSQGTAFLVFQNILRSDSGVYQCLSGGNYGHHITVSVKDFGLSEISTVTQNTEAVNQTMGAEPLRLDDLWVFLFRVAEITMFAIILLTICVISKYGCKGVCCSGESRDTPELRSQRVTHLYEIDV